MPRLKERDGSNNINRSEKMTVFGECPVKRTEDNGNVRTTTKDSVIKL